MRRWVSFIAALLAVLLVGGCGSSQAKRSSPQPVKIVKATGLPTITPKNEVRSHLRGGQLYGTVASPIVGETFTTTNGTWLNSPTSYAYLWQDCDATGANCATGIGTGGTTNTYTVAAGEVGDTIRVVVTATNAGGSASQSSAATGVVIGSGTPVELTPPVLSGAAAQGSLITLTPGTFSNETTQDGTWEDCPTSTSTSCTATNPAGGTAYTLLTSDPVGDYLRLEEVATNTNGNTTVWSNAIGPITAASGGGGGGSGGFTGTCTTTITMATDWVSTFNSMTSGQTLCLDTGSYGALNQGSMLPVNASGVTLTSAPGNTATINGNEAFSGSNDTFENLNFNESASTYTASGGANPSPPCSLPVAEGAVMYGSNNIIQDDNIYQAANSFNGRDILIGMDYSGLTPHPANDIIRDDNLGPAGSCGQTQHLIYDDISTGLQIYDNWFFNDKHGYCIQIYTAPVTTTIHSNVFDDCINAIVDDTSGGGDQTYNNVWINSSGGFLTNFHDRTAATQDTVETNAVYNAGAATAITSGTGAGQVTVSGNIVLGGNPFLNGAVDSDSYALASNTYASQISGYGLWDGIGPPVPNPGASQVYSLTAPQLKTLDESAGKIYNLGPPPVTPAMRAAERSFRRYKAAHRQKARR